MQKKCLTSYCDRAAKSRGLCERCYQLARYAVSKGRTTWQELEDKGFISPGKKPCPFTVAFNAVIEREENAPNAQ